MTISNYLKKDNKEIIIDSVIEMAPEKYWGKKQEEWSLYHQDGFHFIDFYFQPSKNSIALYDDEMIEIISLFNDFSLIQRPKPQVYHEENPIVLSEKPVAEEYYEQSHSLLYETFEFFSHVIEEGKEDDYDMFLTIKENMITFVTSIFEDEIYDPYDPEFLMLSHSIRKYIDKSDHDKLYIITESPSHEKVVRQLIKNGYTLIDNQKTSIYGYIQ